MKLSFFKSYPRLLLLCSYKSNFKINCLKRKFKFFEYSIFKIVLPKWKLKKITVQGSSVPQWVKAQYTGLVSWVIISYYNYSRLKKSMYFTTMWYCFGFHACLETRSCSRNLVTECQLPWLVVKVIPFIRIVGKPILMICWPAMAGTVRSPLHAYVTVKTRGTLSVQRPTGLALLSKCT